MTGQRLLPNIGLTDRWTPGTSGWAAGMDANLQKLDTLLFLTVASASIYVPPTTPSEGDRYIVAVGGSGAWNLKDGQIALFLDAAWTFYVPKSGWRARVIDSQTDMTFNGMGWDAEVHPYDIPVFRYRLPVPPEPIISLVFPRAVTFQEDFLGCTASVLIAPTADNYVLSIKKNGTAVGGITIPLGELIGNPYSFAGGNIAFGLGDVFEVDPPSTLEPTARGLRLMFVGTR